MYLCGVNNSEITYLDSDGTALSSKVSDAAPVKNGRRRDATVSLGGAGGLLAGADAAQYGGDVRCV